MADLKISQLGAISILTPATDVLPVVDSGGVTKKITTNQILGSGGTATLASATISGALDAARLNVTGATIPANGVYLGSANNLSFSAASTLGMTLNSTGLGVGVVPGGTTGNARISIVGGVLYDGSFDIVGNFTNSSTSAAKGVLLGYNNSTNNGIISAAYGNGTEGLTFWTHNGTSWGQRMELTATGNVGIGVTPNAWAAAFKPVQIGSGTVSSAFVGQTNSPVARIMTNSYFDGTNFVKVQNNTAGMYVLQNNQHEWHNAATGTGTFSFTQAMTLDASGNLLVGTTSQNGSWNTKLTLSNDSGTTKWAVGPYLGGVTNFLISAGASAGVYLNGTAATSWTSASDERLKDIIEPISNAIAKVGSLRAVIGKFKFDENNTRKPFLIAQDVQSVLPEAVDASNPEKLGVAYTEVIPLLVAAIKELTIRVQTLEAK